MVLNENVDRKFIPIAGGKGGVGKSVIAVNLALSLSQSGHRVVLVDLDLGSSNLHTMLGLKNTNAGIGNFLSGNSKHLKELMVPTPWEKLFFIPGDVLIYGLADLTKARKNNVMEELLKIDADYVIIDLGAGTNFTVLDFFLISNSGLVVTTPQSTSIMSAYSFFKNYVFRFLQRAFINNKTVENYLKEVLKESRPGSKSTVRDIIKNIQKIDTVAGGKAEAFLEVLQPKLILNKTTCVEDIAIAEGLRDLCRANLKIELECLGTLIKDDIVDKSINAQQPYVLEHPHQTISAATHRMGQKIIQSKNFPEMPLELDYYEDSFELAQIEVENDLQAQPPQGTDENPVTAAETEKLLQIINLQQGKINELQSTIKMLTMERS